MAKSKKAKNLKSVGISLVITALLLCGCNSRTITDRDIIGVWQLESIENRDNPRRQDETTRAFSYLAGWGRMLNIYNEDGTFVRVVIDRREELIMEQGVWKFNDNSRRIEITTHYVIDDNTGYLIPYREFRNVYIISLSDRRRATDRLSDNNIVYRSTWRRIE